MEGPESMPAGRGRNETAITTIKRADYLRFAIGGLREACWGHYLVLSALLPAVRRIRTIYHYGGVHLLPVSVTKGPLSYIWDPELSIAVLFPSQGKASMPAGPNHFDTMFN